MFEDRVHHGDDANAVTATKTPIGRALAREPLALHAAAVAEHQPLRV
jgi:hypothetical protein